MFALAETAAQPRRDHLPCPAFVAHQLHQLLDAILLQQFLGPLLLQRQSGGIKAQLRALAASRLCLPAEPSLRLHGVQQVAHMPARTMHLLCQSLQRGFLRLAATALPQANKMLLQARGGHKRGTPYKNSSVFRSPYYAHNDSR